MSSSSGSSDYALCQQTGSQDSLALQSYAQGENASTESFSITSADTNTSRKSHGVRFNPEVCQHSPPAHEHVHRHKHRHSKRHVPEKGRSAKRKSKSLSKQSEPEVIRCLCAQVYDNARVATPSVSPRGSSYPGRSTDPAPPEYQQQQMDPNSYPPSNYPAPYVEFQQPTPPICESDMKPVVVGQASEVPTTEYSVPAPPDPVPNVEASSEPTNSDSALPPNSPLTDHFITAVSSPDNPNDVPPQPKCDEVVVQQPCEVYTAQSMNPDQQQSPCDDPSNNPQPDNNMGFSGAAVEPEQYQGLSGPCSNDQSSNPLDGSTIVAPASMAKPNPRPCGASDQYEDLQTNSETPNQHELQYNVQSQNEAFADSEAKRESIPQPAAAAAPEQVCTYEESYSDEPCPADESSPEDKYESEPCAEDSEVEEEENSHPPSISEPEATANQKAEPESGPDNADVDCAVCSDTCNTGNVETADSAVRPQTCPAPVLHTEQKSSQTDICNNPSSQPEAIPFSFFPSSLPSSQVDPMYNSQSTYMKRDPFGGTQCSSSLDTRRESFDPHLLSRTALARLSFPKQPPVSTVAHNPPILGARCRPAPPPDSYYSPSSLNNNVCMNSAQNANVGNFRGKEEFAPSDDTFGASSRRPLYRGQDPANESGASQYESTYASPSYSKLDRFTGPAQIYSQKKPPVPDTYLPYTHTSSTRLQRQFFGSPTVSSHGLYAQQTPDFPVYSARANAQEQCQREKDPFDQNNLDDDDRQALNSKMERLHRGTSDFQCQPRSDFDQKSMYPVASGQAQENYFQLLQQMSYYSLCHHPAQYSESCNTDLTSFRQDSLEGIQPSNYTQIYHQCVSKTAPCGCGRCTPQNFNAQQQQQQPQQQQQQQQPQQQQQQQQPHPNQSGTTSCVTQHQFARTKHQHQPHCQRSRSPKVPPKMSRVPSRKRIGDQESSHSAYRCPEESSLNPTARTMAQDTREFVISRKYNNEETGLSDAYDVSLLSDDRALKGYWTERNLIQLPQALYHDIRTNHKVLEVFRKQICSDLPIVSQPSIDEDSQHQTRSCRQKVKVAADDVHPTLLTQTSSRQSSRPVPQETHKHDRTEEISSAKRGKCQPALKTLRSDDELARFIISPSQEKDDKTPEKLNFESNRYPRTKGPSKQYPSNTPQPSVHRKVALTDATPKLKLNHQAPTSGKHKDSPSRTGTNVFEEHKRNDWSGHSDEASAICQDESSDTIQTSPVSIKKVTLQVRDPPLVEDAKSQKRTMNRSLTPHPRSGRDLRYTSDEESAPETDTSKGPTAEKFTDQIVTQEHLPPPLVKIHSRSDPEIFAVNLLSTVTAPLEVLRKSKLSGPDTTCLKYPPTEILSPDSSFSAEIRCPRKIVHSEERSSPKKLKIPATKLTKSSKILRGLGKTRQSDYVSAFHAVKPSHKLDPTDLSSADDFNSSNSARSAGPVCHSGEHPNATQARPRSESDVASSISTSNNLNDLSKNTFNPTLLNKFVDTKCSQEGCSFHSRTLGEDQAHCFDYRHYRKEVREGAVRPIPFASTCPSHSAVFMLQPDIQNAGIFNCMSYWDYRKSHCHSHHHVHCPRCYNVRPEDGHFTQCSFCEPQTTGIGSYQSAHVHLSSFFNTYPSDAAQWHPDNPTPTTMNHLPDNTDIDTKKKKKNFMRRLK